MGEDSHACSALLGVPLHVSTEPTAGTQQESSPEPPHAFPVVHVPHLTAGYLLDSLVGEGCQTTGDALQKRQTFESVTRATY